MILAEQDDEGQDGQRYSRSESTVLIDALAQIEEWASRSYLQADHTRRLDDVL
jgi:hypothetical protein